MSFENKLSSIVIKYKELEKSLENIENLNHIELASIAKEHSDIKEVAELSIYRSSLQNQLKEVENILSFQDIDQEMKDMAEEERVILKKQIKENTEKLEVLLLPKDEMDEKGAIIEIRAGTGGEEAALFASVLLRMYQRYAEKMRWKFEILSISETGLDGIKEVTVSISGSLVFANLKFESGVHRVQRVPVTESSGRIHTSAATVAVLPELEEVDIDINPNDIRIDVYRASGAGGQHVNTTDSAVRITHIPSGLVVCQQDEKSQHKNKAKAMKILRSRLYELEAMKQQSERDKMRLGQIGSGDRSERIRTYNYPQNRLTDHRIGLTIYSLSEVFEGSLELVINPLIAEDQAKKLAEFKEEA